MINYPLEARVWARTGHARRARRAGHVRHGKVHTATRGNAVWTYAYYNRGQPKSETLAIDGHSFTLTHGYNASGHENSLTCPSGLTVSYAPDGLGRPAQAGTYASDARYAPNGRLSDVTYGNGVSWHATYNTRQLPRTWRYRWAFSTYSYRVLDYDANANPTSILEDGIFDGGDRPRYAPGLDSGTFTYDALDRLTGADYVVRGPLAYAYDPLGNVRTSSELGSFTYDASNRVQSRIHGAVFTYTWDARGNLTSDGERSFSWNLANELVEDLYGTTYAYDARGWRVKQEVTAQHTDDGVPHTRYFVYDAAHRLVERWDNGTVTDFVSLGDKAVARVKGGTTTYIHGDYQDTPLLETDANGAITRTPQIYAYNLTGAAGVEEIPGYTGAAADKETGLLYLGARYLHGPRFLSPDPAGLDPTTPFGLNRYAYANDNPIRFVDPLGLYSCDRKGNAEGCDAIAQARGDIKSAASQLPASSADRRRLVSVLSFLGKEGDKNGVTVAFGAAGGNNAVTDTKGKNVTITFNLKQMSKNLSGRGGGSTLRTETAGVLAHEATHGINGRAIGSNPYNFSQEVATEHNAFEAQAAVARGLGVYSAYTVWDPTWSTHVSLKRAQAVGHQAIRAAIFWCKPGVPGC